MEHTDWDNLDAPVREAIERRTGPVHRARTATAGLNSQLALILDAVSGPVFVKRLPISHPGVVRQHREAMINSHITLVAPGCSGRPRRPGGTCSPSTTFPVLATLTTGPTPPTYPKSWPR